MSYNEKYPIISYRLPSFYKKKIEKIALKEGKSFGEKSKEILQLFADGKLIDMNLEVELLKARLEKIKVETKYLQLKNDYFENFKKPLSDSGTRILSRSVKHQQLISPENNQSPYDESNNRFMCVDCGNCFDFDSVETFLTQMREYKNHIIANHNRDLNALEKDVFGRVRFNE
jgi:hypothetical protein